MESSVIVRFRPAGPWRPGSESGVRHLVDRVFHSDALYSAVTHALSRLGMLEEWLAATALAPDGSAVRFTSLFPCLGATLFVIPPLSVWPPTAPSKVRWKGARFVPLPLVNHLLAGETLDEDHWVVDGHSQCLLSREESQRSPGPVRVALRPHAAVDRVRRSALPHATACLEFAPEAGLWGVVAFASHEARERWHGPVTAALRLLGDSGLGGERSLGWGRADSVEFEARSPEDYLQQVPRADSPQAGMSTRAYWLLSLFSPAPFDEIDWGQGSYFLVTREGRVESPAGRGEEKKNVRMVAEGSVLHALTAPAGAARDVAPDGFPHPVWRSGFAFALPLPEGGAA